MGRKRFITSDMSTDEKIAALAEENQTAALMWPWFTTAFDDWGRMGANPMEVKLSIFPAFSFTSKEIAETIKLVDKYGLAHYYMVEGKPYLAVNPATWYKYQTYIKADRKEKQSSKCPAPPNPPWEIKENQQNTAIVADGQQRTAEIVPSPSPSPSLSPTDKDLYPEEVSLEKQLHRGGCEKTSVAAELIKAFEKDFGRPLGSTESEQITKWLEKNEPDVIREALRRAVLNGKYNFKYIDRILLSWEKANKRTLREVLEYEQAIEKQRTKQTPAEDAAKVVQISDKRREETIRSACDYIRLQCGPDPPRAKAEEIAHGYGDEFVPVILERLYGGRSP